MATSQTVLFTVIPRGISVNGRTLPVSVLVSPQLAATAAGEQKLGSFPDFLNWTAQVKERGVVFTLRSGTQQQEARVDTSVLEPRLWKALFNESTFVRSYKYRDLSTRGVITYSVRESLSTLKSIYQEAAVTLALPNSGTKDSTGQNERGNRQTLAGLTEGLDIHWNPDKGRRLREAVRLRRSGEGTTPAVRPLDNEGLIAEPRSASAARSAALPFTVFHKMPTPDRATAPPVKVDPDAFDFHQALSMLESHPELQRALGLVFDLELPLAFLPATGTTFGRVSVDKVSFAWRTPTKTPPLDTAYVRLVAGTQDFFFTAPRALAGGGPGSASAWQILGLLNLDPQRFGLAQLDVDGGMHKMIALAETWQNPDPGRNLDANAKPEDAPNPELHDTDATLPALRSSGFQLYADGRGAALLDLLAQSKAFRQAVESSGAQPRPFFAEDLARGYRLDIWDSRTNDWHSLHRRIGKYEIGDNREPFATTAEEGFFEFAAAQPAPGATADPDASTDLYVHEVVARWAGWSLSVPPAGKSLSRHADPAKAVPPDGDDPDFRTDEAITKFKVRATYRVQPGSLPELRYGRRYRVRARAVDLCGNSVAMGTPLVNSLSLVFALPRDAEGTAYLRYDPVIAPLVLIRDAKAVTLPGSAVDRLVIRTFNGDQTKDAIAADLTANDRHIVPPRTSVENGERHGMFDDPVSGKLKSDAPTYKLIGERDAGEFAKASITIAGKTDNYPLEPAASIDALPNLPDPMARGAAFRNLPGAADLARAQVYPGAGTAKAVAYEVLSDPNPRPGSATLVEFSPAGSKDWLDLKGMRFVLDEPAPGQTDLRPAWDPTGRVLRVFLPKGQLSTVALSSYLHDDDLKLMGVWHWMREYIERSAIFNARPVSLQLNQPVDEIAQVLQRAVEGGHWMLNPPRLLTLVHAVQQPLGRPVFRALRVDHAGSAGSGLLTAPSRLRTDPAELAPVSAWRRAGSTDAYLLGAIGLHAASTGKIDLMAEWTDPVDDVTKPGPGTASFRAHVDELPLVRVKEGYLQAPGKDYRSVGYYDPEHDQIALVQSGDKAIDSSSFPLQFGDAAPRHRFRDTKRHRVNYTAVASSRYREYFPQELEFSRTSEPVEVDVPASTRPLAPSVNYVVPTFGWQRQAETNLKRSVRFGGGLRVYLDRPWYSSGEGELLGVACWNYANGSLDDGTRDKFKSGFTQWGMDPIWKTGGLTNAPAVYNFADAAASDYSVAAEAVPGSPATVDVAGFSAYYDESRGLWYSDLTVNLYSATYAPFIRLALVRYQPHALPDARISRVVLADFAQLTPDRSALISSDPHHPRKLRVTISGVAPTAPLPSPPAGATAPPRPTHILVRVQQRGPIQSDLAWTDVPATVATVQQFYEGPGISQPDLALWVGEVNFAAAPPAGEFRLLIEEFEYVAANYLESGAVPGRLIYAETVEVG